MIVSKKKYDFLLDRYEQAASRADLLERLAFIDRWVSALLPTLTRRMPDRERLMWEDMLKTRSADHAYGIVRDKSQG
ncbi:hypothetical protein M2755_004069 [Salmonella enterica]|nr:hypothetical protein [Salmonella enterica]